MTTPVAVAAAEMVAVRQAALRASVGMKAGAGQQRSVIRKGAFDSSVLIMGERMMGMHHRVTLQVLAGLFALCATPASAVVQINVGAAAVGADGKATISITLAAGGASVGGMQNDIIFDNTQVTLKAADCRINAAIGTAPHGCNQDPVVGPCKTLSKTLKQCGTNPQPAGCPTNAGTKISAFRGIIAATAVPNTNAIPNGVLYTCIFSIAPGGTLPATLTNSHIVASTPTGKRIDGATGSNGAVTGTGGKNSRSRRASRATPRS